MGTPSEYTSYAYNNTWSDQVSQVKVYNMSTYQIEYTINYYYDNAGNLTSTVDSRTSYYNESFTWEGRSLLTYSKSGTSASYSYNQNGIRDSKTVNGVTTTYYLDRTKVLYETDGTNDIYYTYDVDGSLLSINYNGTEYYYVLNVLGDVTHLIDSSGDVVVEYRYDSYGNLDDSITLNGVGLANPYRYRSYRFDNETGYYYLQSRYYNPETGRFINADGILKSSETTLGHNMYAYVNNNPIMYNDPTGELLGTLAIIALVAYSVWIVDDVIDIVNEELHFDSKSGNLENSHKVQNPSVIFGYTLYLKYVSDDGDFFEGSAGGIASEWIWHNAIYDITSLLDTVGVSQVGKYNVNDVNEQAITAGFGSSVFRDNTADVSRTEVVYPSLIIEGLLFPASLGYDVYKEYIEKEY